MFAAKTNGLGNAETRPGRRLRPGARFPLALFRRGHGRRLGRAELYEQARFLGLSEIDVPRLDMAEAADFFRYPRERDRRRVISRVRRVTISSINAS